MTERTIEEQIEEHEVALAELKAVRDELPTGWGQSPCGDRFRSVGVFRLYVNDDRGENIVKCFLELSGGASAADCRALETEFAAACRAALAEIDLVESGKPDPLMSEECVGLRVRAGEAIK